jgi:hypothetical protein
LLTGQTARLLTNRYFRSFWRGAPVVAEVVAEVVVEDLHAEVDAFVADRAGWSGDDLLDVAGAFAAEGAPGELAAELAAFVVVVELFGDLASGFGELLVRLRSPAQIGVWFVDCGGELVEGSVQSLPGDDWESWAVAPQFPRRPPLGIDAVRCRDKSGVVSVA